MRYFTTEHPTTGEEILVTVNEDYTVIEVRDGDKSDMDLTAEEQRAVQKEADRYFTE